MREPLEPGTLVLSQNAKLDTMHGSKFADRWFGPFRVVRRLEKGSYVLAELDGTELKKVYAARRIRRYYLRGAKEEDVIEDENQEIMENDSEESDQEEEENLPAEEENEEQEERQEQETEQDGSKTSKSTTTSQDQIQDQDRIQAPQEESDSEKVSRVRWNKER